MRLFVSAPARALATAAHWLVIAVALLAVAAPSVVDGCSCRRSRYGKFVLGAGDTIPRDAPGIPWTGNSLVPFRDEPSPVTTFERHVGAGRVAARFTVRSESGFDFIVPEGGLRPGDRFSVSVREGFGSSEKIIDATVTVGPDPIALDGAKLVVSDRRLGTVPRMPQSYTGACSDDVEADIVEARVELPPSVEPYREYLLYTTLVDGKSHEHAPSSECARDRGAPRGRSRLALAGSELLFTTCDEAGGLAPGAHELALQITTPDGRHSFTTPAARFELDCATSPRPEPEPPAPPAKAAPASASTPPASAGPTVSVGPPAVAPGCTLMPFSSPWLFVSLPLLVSRRRRAPPLAPRRIGGPGKTVRGGVHAGMATDR